MRTEAEIREVIELCQGEPVSDAVSGTARDATIEALRWCLGINDGDSSPMSCTLDEIVQDMRRDKQSTVSE